MYNEEKIIKKLIKIRTEEGQFNYVIKIIENLNYDEKIEILSKIMEKIDNDYKRLERLNEQSNLLFGENSFKSAKEIKPLKNLNNLLSNMKMELETSNSKNEDKHYYPKIILSESQLKYLIKITNNDISCCLDEGKTDNINQKICKLESVKKILQEESKIKKFNYSLILKSKDEELIEEAEKLIRQIRLIKRTENYIDDCLRINHKIQKSLSKKKLKEEECFVCKKKELNTSLIDEKNLEEKCLKDNLSNYLKLVKENKLAENQIKVLEYSKELSIKMINNIINDDEIIILIGKIRSSVNKQLLNLDKNETKNNEERKVLKEIRIIFDFISKNYREDLLKTNHNYLTDVIYYFLEDAQDYPYIKRLTEQVPHIVNVRNNGEHILVTILKEYISNYKKMLNDKKSNYINPDYLKEVYVLFSKSPRLYVKKEDKIVIDQLLIEFQEFLKDNVSNFDRQKEIKKEIRNLKTMYFYSTKEPKLELINSNNLIYQINSLDDIRKESLDRNCRKDLTKEKTFTMGKNNIAYSVEKKENITKIKIHTLDINSYISKGTPISSLLYNYMIENEEIDKEIKSYLKFMYHSANPTITYELSFENNEVIDFKIYKSKIKIDKQCNDHNLYFNDDADLNIISDLTKKLYYIKTNEKPKFFNISEASNLLEEQINLKLIDFIQNNDIPFIYCGKNVVNDYINNMNGLNSIFNRLDQKEFVRIHKIISENAGEFCYSLKPFETEDMINLSLFRETNYLYLMNQYIIDTLIINHKTYCVESSSLKNRIIRECSDLEHNLNVSINYINPDDFEFKNKRKRNKLKEYYVSK